MLSYKVKMSRSIFRATSERTDDATEREEPPKRLLADGIPSTQNGYLDRRARFEGSGRVGKGYRGRGIREETIGYGTRRGGIVRRRVKLCRVVISREEGEGRMAAESPKVDQGDLTSVSYGDRGRTAFASVEDVGEFVVGDREDGDG